MSAAQHTPGRSGVVLEGDWEYDRLTKQMTLADKHNVKASDSVSRDGQALIELQDRLVIAERTLSDWTRRAAADHSLDYSRLVENARTSVASAHAAIAKATGSTT